MVLPGFLRSRLAGALALSVAAVALTMPETTAPMGRVEALCPAALQVRIGDTVACTHLDEAPPGVDVTERPSTAELADRPGAAAAAQEAAEELGIPSPVTVATTASLPDVTCDGDGTSGFRVQAMYVVEAGRTNRYAALLDSFKLWAAGTDDVVNRSAALTGGVRHIRYVTDAAGGVCVANVLNVTVPAGAMASFGSTVAAVQALGYTAPARKYLMWTDATSLCGVASMYTSDGPTQANPNNGSYPQYARIDSGCWGLGNGAQQHSVEAHELMHALGGVQSTAPHSTKVGHCYDESDTMCYSDGGGIAMQQICPSAQEFFFDCNNDDYFSTYPQSGNYLTTHWNAADSRFLIGGGNGSGGGLPGTPTVLGAVIAVNNPAVPGLSTQASVVPELPSGRTLASVVWTAKRTDCVFSTPTQIQTTVTCNATVATTSSVTATLVDSTGATKAVTSPLTFAVGGARPVSLALTAASQSGPEASVCTGAAFPLRAAATDVATGQPIKGLTVAITKQPSTATAPATAGNAITTVEGIGTLNQTATLRTAYVARTAAGTVYAAATPVGISAQPGLCAPELTGGRDLSSIYYADPVTVSGTLVRTIGVQQVPVSGASVAVKVLPTGALKPVSLGTAVTAADGSYRVVVKPTTTGALSVELPASAAYLADRVELGTIAVQVPLTSHAAEVDKDDVGYGESITVSGLLRRNAGGVFTPLVGASVGINVTRPGLAPAKIGTAKVLANGTYTVAVPLKMSGALTAVYAGAAGQPPATVALGAVTAGTWTTTVTANASATNVIVGGSFLLTGAATRTYDGVTSPAKAIRVSAYFTPTGGSAVLVSGTTTTATGTYSLKVLPKATGTWTVRIVNVIGYGESTSVARAVTVG